MDFAWSAEEETFRGEIREFLQAELPEGWGMTQFWDPDDDAQFASPRVHAKTRQEELLAVSLPQEYGALTGRSETIYFHEELAHFDAPVVGRTPRFFK